MEAPDRDPREHEQEDHRTGRVSAAALRSLLVGELDRLERDRRRIEQSLGALDDLVEAHRERGNLRRAGSALRFQHRPQFVQRLA